ncbi:MAG: AAA family ATPase, partial [Phormidesmis sp.]
MKTSFAKTFKKISEGKEPKEELYNKPSTFDISIDGVEICGEDILVVEPFNPGYETQNISALLVNSEKKRRYDEVFKQIAATKSGIITVLNKLSKIKKVDIEGQLNKDLGCENIFDAAKILSEADYGVAELSKVQYQKIFDPNVVELLKSPSVQENIGNYTVRYNELIEKSSVFKKGVFNPAKASSVIKTLKKENFFEADHKVMLNGQPSQIGNHKDFEGKIQAEKESILNDATLQEISDKIIGGVASIKSFQDLLEEFPEIASELGDLDCLRKILWASYCQSNKEQFEKLLSLYEANKAELATIEEAAQLEETLWYQAHATFMERFHVPFSMQIENHANAILGTTAPNVVFTFDDENGESICFNRGQLDSLDILSVGERRSMYLLYIIFEFRTRLSSGKNTVIVVDDIADSFDYKNKYAIIEYLKELAEEDSFRLVVLTHNFDFYRTFQSRV